MPPRVAAVLAAALAAVNCGGRAGEERFVVGETDVTVTSEAATFTWLDLPEALHRMQTRTATSVPDGLWDVHLFVVPGWRPIGVPGHICEYETVGDFIEVRARGEPTTADSCIPHEFAHRWAELTGHGLGHNPEWARLHAILRTAAGP